MTTRSTSQEITLKPLGFKKAAAGKLRHGLALLLTALLVVSIWISPATADALPTDCTLCHGTFVDVHGSVTHQATPGSGAVTLFPDNGHDDGGWFGPTPYFAVSVDCVTCHNTYLPEIHSNDCSVCHPSPYDTLSGCGQAGWGGGCQQGGCHSVFHANAFTAHAPFEDPYDSGNDCLRCHEASTWDVVQANCLNCHATPVSGYGSPPVTTSNAQGSYDGAAEIVFTITEPGNKVGIGRTLYRLDGGEMVSGSKVVVSADGSHELEFWSVDQYGVSEASHNTVYFTVQEDSIPPVTTTTAKAQTYYQGALFTFTATDDSASGVKNTYYTLNGGLTQTGNTVTIPNTPGTFTYTLVYWSVDWSGNIEPQHSVTFTVVSGYGTITLVWWDSDTVPAHAPSGSDQATWQVRRGGPTGFLAASGSGTASSGWDGVDTITVPVRPEQYYVYILWDAIDDAGDQAEYVDIKTNGQGVTVHY